MVRIMVTNSTNTSNINEIIVVITKITALTKREGTARIIFPSAMRKSPPFAIESTASVIAVMLLVIPSESSTHFIAAVAHSNLKKLSIQPLRV